jgi:hypothetical protein
MCLKLNTLKLNIFFKKLLSLIFHNSNLRIEIKQGLLSIKAVFPSKSSEKRLLY